MSNINLKDLRNITTGKNKWKFTFDFKKGYFSGCEKNAKISEVAKIVKYSGGVIYYDANDSVIMFTHKKHLM